MNCFNVKVSGLRWIVKRDGESTWSANAFNDEVSAIAYAEVLANSNRPAQIHIFNSWGELVDTRTFPKAENV
jgi:hypothetical protein